jgi:nucleoside-diphosphate-sugar epimerase
MTRRILLTGSTGFVGRYLRDSFTVAGHQVVPLLRASGARPLPDPVAAAATAINSNEIDAIVHVAGLINGAPAAVEAANRTYTGEIVEAARRSGRKPDFFFLSSVSAENGLGVYGDMKRQAEQLISSGAPAGWNALRASLVHGPNDTKNVGLLIRAARHWPVIPAIGGDTVLLQPLYVADLAQAFLVLLEGRGAQGAIYTVSGPRQERLSDMIRMIQDRIQRHAPLVSIPVEPVRRAITWADGLLPFLRLPVQQIQNLSNHPPYRSEAAAQALGFRPRKFQDAIADYVGPRPGAAGD